MPASTLTMAPEQRYFGACGECNRQYLVDESGNVTAHSPPGRPWIEQRGCEGSGKRPSEPPLPAEEDARLHRFVQNAWRLTSYGGGSRENEAVRLLCQANPPAAALEIELLGDQVDDLKTKLGPGPKKYDMTALARSFPTFAHGKWPGLDAGGSFNFDAIAFFTHIAKTGMSHGEYLVASFLADVWNGNDCKKQNGTSTRARERIMGVAKFDLHEALVTWDSGHRAAFVAWAKEPWFP